MNQCSKFYEEYCTQICSDIIRSIAPNVVLHLPLMWIFRKLDSFQKRITLQSGQLGEEKNLHNVHKWGNKIRLFIVCYEESKISKHKSSVGHFSARMCSYIEKLKMNKNG